MSECYEESGILGSNIIIKKTLYKLNGFDQNLIPSEDKSLIIDAHLSKKIIIQNNYILYKNNNKNKLSNDYRKLQKENKLY